MNSTSKETELLLVMGGGWLVAVESRAVCRVESAWQTVDSNDRWLADLLGASASGSSRERRVLALAPAGQQRLVVDRVVGVQFVPEDSLCTLPATLHCLGVPDWLMGSYWRSEHELVLLMEPSSAVGSSRRGGGP